MLVHGGEDGELIRSRGQHQLNRVFTILLWLALMILPRQGWSIDSCFECVLGIWDDAALTRNHGEIVVGQPKEIYVGIKFAEGFNATNGIEFSIAGLSGFLVTAVDPIIPTVVVGSINAPADTSMSSNGAGGLGVAWSSCLMGNQALLRVSLLASTNVTNALLKVKKRYPPTHPDVRTPLFCQCSNPICTPTRLTGGIYIFNWNGDPTVGVDGATWSMLKQLYR